MCKHVRKIDKTMLMPVTGKRGNIYSTADLNLVIFRKLSERQLSGSGEMDRMTSDVPVKQLGHCSYVQGRTNAL